MREVLQGLLIAGMVAWTICVLAVLWVRHRLRRRLRIAPRVRSIAPTVWLVSPTAAARLHHRLRRVGASAAAAATLDPALLGLADELIGNAVALEPTVVALTRTGRTGASIRRDLSARVSELESSARHLATLATQSARGSGAGAPIRDRLTALEAARQELTDIEVSAGLYSRA